MASLHVHIKRTNKRAIPELDASVGSIRFTCRMSKSEPRKYTWQWQRWPTSELFSMPLIRKPTRGLEAAIGECVKEIRMYVREHNLCGDREESK